MLSIGIIGGIGSGKTVICKIFETLEIPVFYADIVIKKMYEETTVKPLVIDILGKDVYNNQTIDRRKMSEKLFSNKSLLLQFQHQLYPLLIDRFIDWKQQQIGKFVLLEAAVLLESPVKFPIDKIIAVESTVNLRMQRIKERDHFDHQEIQRRIALQMTDEERRKFSDFIIDNSNKTSVIEQVHNFCKQLQ